MLLRRLHEWRCRPGHRVIGELCVLDLLEDSGYDSHSATQLIASMAYYPNAYDEWVEEEERDILPDIPSYTHPPYFTDPTIKKHHPTSQTSSQTSKTSHTSHRKGASSLRISSNSSPYRRPHGGASNTSSLSSTHLSSHRSHLRSDADIPNFPPSDEPISTRTLVHWVMTKPDVINVSNFSGHTFLWNAAANGECVCCC